MKAHIIIVLFFVSISAQAQKNKVPAPAYYTLCGQACTGTLNFTLAEFKNCKKELVPIAEGDKITSFAVSMNINGSFLRFITTGNSLEGSLKQVLEGIKTGDKILIEEVKMMRENKTVKIPGVVIKLK